MTKLKAFITIIYTLAIVFVIWEMKHLYIFDHVTQNAGLLIALVFVLAAPLLIMFARSSK